MNLIKDPWIPVLTRFGMSRVIAPWEMTDPDILRPDWPRADLNLACYELLIGLVFLSDPPAHDEDWEMRQTPDSNRLRARLEPFAKAFELTGDGARFMQDLEPLEGKLNPPDMLFIDSAGANTAKNNADLMVRRDRYPSLDPAMAAMALYTFQAFAPSGGAGNRTSMRGGGPLVTLIDPGGGLWDLVWANTPYGKPAAVEALPWMRPTVSSQSGEQVWPEQANPVEAFFGMPRRLRLVGKDKIIGVIQRPYGTNYAGWVHPISPYYRMNEGAELLPAHPRAGLFGYRHWLGIVAAATGDHLRYRAAMVSEWQNRRPKSKARVLVSGWAMDNMKPRDFIWSVEPLVELPDDAARLLMGMIEAAELFGLAFRQALSVVLSEGDAREAVREVFFAQTQTAFEARLADLVAGQGVEDVARAWLSDMRQAGMRLFEDHALPGLDMRDSKKQEEIVKAHRILLLAFAGKSGNGKKAYGKLELEPLPHKTTELVK